MKYIDTDGNDPILTGAAVAVAAGTALGVGITLYATYEVTKNYLENPGSVNIPNQSTVMGVALGYANSVYNTVNSWFSSEENDTGDDESGSQNLIVKEQAKKISKEIGKNSVSLPDGTRVNLSGKGHRDKSGNKIETPHTHDSEQNIDPKTGKTYTKTKKIPRPATQEDINKVNETLGD